MAIQKWQCYRRNEPNEETESGFHGSKILLRMIFLSISSYAPSLQAGYALALP